MLAARLGYKSPTLCWFKHFDSFGGNLTFLAFLFFFHLGILVLFSRLVWPPLSGPMCLRGPRPRQYWTTPPLELLQTWSKSCCYSNWWSAVFKRKCARGNWLGLDFDWTFYYWIGCDWTLIGCNWIFIGLVVIGLWLVVIGIGCKNILAELAPSSHLITLRRFTKMGLSLSTGMEKMHLNWEMKITFLEMALNIFFSLAAFWLRTSWKMPPRSWSPGWRNTLQRVSPLTTPWSTTTLLTPTYSVSQFPTFPKTNLTLSACICSFFDCKINASISDLTKHPNFLAAASQILDSPKLRVFSSR